MEVIKSDRHLRIVIAAYNGGGGVCDNFVIANRIVGNTPTTFPDVGAVLAASDAPDTTAFANMVIRSVIGKSMIPGIVVHSNIPDDEVAGTVLTDNMISVFGFEAPSEVPAQPAGIKTVAEVFPVEMHAPAFCNTLILFNSISSDSFVDGIYRAVHASFANLITENVSIAVYLPG